MTALENYLKFAIDTARIAGKLTLKYFQGEFQAETKGDNTPVTNADREAEGYIRQQIESRFPGHEILGEEFGASQEPGNAQTASSCRWLIDPIDGTRSFVRGVPLYSVLLGMEIDGRSTIGVAYFPALDEIIWAADGSGCFWNGRPCHVSTQDRLDKALVTHFDTGAFARHGKQAAWERLVKASGYRAGWCDAYGYLLTATGRADITIDPQMSPWDCGPFPVILAEAGGYFGDWQGHVSLYAKETFATNLNLLPQVIKILNQDK